MTFVTDLLSMKAFSSENIKVDIKVTEFVESGHNLDK